MKTAIGKKICPECGLTRTKEGYDACLGKLPGLMNACCGHGKYGSGTYVQFLDRKSIGGDDAKKIIEILKRNK